MKLNAAILVSFCTTVMLTACQKDKQPDTNTTLNKVKSYTESVSISGAEPIVATYNIAYDADNRITSITQTDIPGQQILIFLYLGYPIFDGHLCGRRIIYT